eukprot:7284809-Prymnesium_polylepis.1
MHYGAAAERRSHRSTAATKASNVSSSLRRALRITPAPKPSACSATAAFLRLMERLHSSSCIPKAFCSH